MFGRNKYKKLIHPPLDTCSLHEHTKQYVRTVLFAKRQIIFIARMKNYFITFVLYKYLKLFYKTNKLPVSTYKSYVHYK